MKLTISQMAKITGVSVRTLHYYDEIDLLKPCLVNPENGYRYYDEEDLSDLQQILFFRELDFSLKQIAKIMKSSDYNREEALEKQRQLLKLKRNRLDKIILLLDRQLKGDSKMSFNEFDTSDFEAAKKQYEKEVKEKWGSTDAYKQNQKKTASYTNEDWKNNTAKMDELLKKFSEKVGTDPANAEVQNLVEQWQQHITDCYYDCTKEILAGLGQMYSGDQRFKDNMDKFGEGTSQLISDAIAIYCK